MKNGVWKTSVRRQTVACVIFLLFIFSCVIPSMGGVPKEQPLVSARYVSIEKANDGDIPTWYQGDEWIFTVNPLYFSSPNGSFSGSIQNLKQKVVGVTNGVYDVQLTGDISGTVTVSGVSGQLTGQITGGSHKRVSDLADISSELSSQGTIMVIIIPVPYELNLVTTSSPPLETFDFPLTVSEEWQLTSMITTSGSFVIQGYVDESWNETQYIDETVPCTQKEQVSVPAGTFECYKIDRSEATIWYSSDVGNIVKATIDQSGSNMTIQATLALQSFSRAAQPITVTQDIEPNRVIPGIDVVISGKAKNTGTGAPIQNAAISIDIPATGESYTTTTNATGYYSKTIVAPTMTDDTASGRETGSGGIIVSCLSGGLSGYRIQSLVTMQDVAPGSPIIDGPTEGKAKIAYNYTFVSTDPEGDMVSYFIDWGDGTNSSWLGPNAPGEIMTVSHTFTKRGTYTITSMARDEYYAESAWGALEVTMPKGVTSSFLVHFLQSHPNMFPLLHRLLQGMYY